MSQPYKPEILACVQLAQYGNLLSDEGQCWTCSKLPDKDHVLGWELIIKKFKRDGLYRVLDKRIFYLDRAPRSDYGKFWFSFRHSMKNTIWVE
uniref:Uncharacterized protein n=1 Tax=Clandestinovirus TaxID=2831644 RepID=A0A8F8PQP0_9VIRU|nr:hypothetical protein KOM_12_24 [Clandestinovirus]